MTEQELKQDIRQYAINHVAAKFWRLKARKFVLFPYLRARHLLKKLNSL